MSTAVDQADLVAQANRDLEGASALQILAWASIGLTSIWCEISRTVSILIVSSSSSRKIKTSG